MLALHLCIHSLPTRSRKLSNTCTVIGKRLCHTQATLLLVYQQPSKLTPKPHQHRSERIKAVPQARNLSHPRPPATCPILPYSRSSTTAVPAPVAFTITMPSARVREAPEPNPRPPPRLCPDVLCCRCRRRLNEASSSYAVVCRCGHSRCGGCRQVG